MADVFVMPVTFNETVAKMLGAERAFDTHTLPATFRVDPEPLAPTPTKPLGPYMLRVFVVGVFMEVKAKMLGDVSTLEMKAFPNTLRVAPAPTPPIPIDPDVP